MAYFTNFVLCLLGIIFANPFLGTEAKTCPRDWLQHQDNCYGYFDNELSWDNAENDCQSYGRGAHLASVLTKAESAQVAEHISTHQQQPSNVWIGLHDVRQKGKWSWVDESTYKYKAWMTNQPDNFGQNEYCVELVIDTGFAQWNDAECKKPNAYICKHEL